MHLARHIRSFFQKSSLCTKSCFRYVSSKAVLSTVTTFSVKAPIFYYVFAHRSKVPQSRLLSGARKPKVNGAAAWRLVSGIYLAADEKGRTNKLCEIIRCESDCSANEIKTHLIKWLYDGEEADAAKPLSPVNKTPYRAFGEKLGAAMELTGLSNIRMGRLLNIDPSYISRFRSGLRSPKANPKMMSLLNIPESLQRCILPRI